MPPATTARINRKATVAKIKLGGVIANLVTIRDAADTDSPEQILAEGIIKALRDQHINIGIIINRTTPDK